MFFVLSGFLITWLLLKELRSAGHVDYRAFYLRRTFRIFPAYYALVFATFGAHWMLGRHWSAGQTWSGILYGVDFYIPAMQALSHPINHAWSLSIEEQFYVLWPVGLVLLARGGQRRLVAGLAGFVAAALVVRTIAVLGFGATWFSVVYSFAGRADTLAIGCLLAVVLETEWGLKQATALGRKAWVALILALAIVGLRAFGGALYLTSVGFTIEAVLIAAMLVVLLQQSHHPFWRWLDHPSSRYIGLLSYSLYLWHAWAIAIADRLPLPLALRIMLGAFGSIVLAAASYRVIERPFLKLKHRFVTA